MLPKTKLVLDPQGNIFVSLGFRKWAGRVLSVKRVDNPHGTMELFKVTPSIQWVYVLKPEETQDQFIR